MGVFARDFIWLIAELAARLNTIKEYFILKLAKHSKGERSLNLRL